MKKFRNKVVSEIRKSKNDYYSQYFARCKDELFNQGPNSVASKLAEYGGR